MALTFAQALGSWEFHYHGDGTEGYCVPGPVVRDRNGHKRLPKRQAWYRAGRTRVRNPETRTFAVPVRRGFRESKIVTGTADRYHAVEDCPLRQGGTR